MTPRAGSALVAAGLAASAYAGALLVLPALSPRAGTWSGVLLAGLAGFFDLWDALFRLHRRRRLHEAALARPGGPPGPPERAPWLASVELDVGRFSPRQVELHVRPWAVVVSVHDLERELEDFLEGVAPFRERLYVVDDASTDRTAERLLRAGLRVLCAETNRRKPGALRELVRSLPEEIVTVVVMDPDIRFPEGPEGRQRLLRSIFDLQRSGHAAFCPRVTVRPDGLLSQLQELEYGLSCDLGRRSLGPRGVTAGVSVYRRDALERALSRHTLSVYAEDLQNALLLVEEGETVYYDGRLSVTTLGKRTWKSWLSQRVGWSFGLLKVYSESFEAVRRCASGGPFYTYQYLVYLGAFGLALHPLRVLSALVVLGSLLNGLDDLLGLAAIPNVPLTEPSGFLFATTQYLVIASLALATTVPRESRLRLLPALPVFGFYTLLHMLPVTLGYLNWLSLRTIGRRLYRDHYQDEASLLSELRSGAS